jgi:tetratricopeptide (TPR) repeat protein
VSDFETLAKQNLYQELLDLSKKSIESTETKLWYIKALIGLGRYEEVLTLNFEEEFQNSGIVLLGKYFVEIWYTYWCLGKLDEAKLQMDKAIKLLKKSKSTIYLAYAYNLYQF